MGEYDPDKVASLGPEIRALAERKTKEIVGAFKAATDDQRGANSHPAVRKSVKLAHCIRRNSGADNRRWPATLLLAGAGQ